MNTQEQIIFNTANRLLAGTKTAAICIELADGKSAYLGDDAGVMRMLQNKDQSCAAVRGEAVALTDVDRLRMPKRDAFIEWAKDRAFDVTESKDAWGNREFVHPHIESIWFGWFHAPSAVSARAADAPSEPSELPICRDDGRCQYAIDHQAEGMGHCPAGKCCMPDEESVSLETACRNLIIYLDNNPPMGESLLCVRQIRNAIDSQHTEASSKPLTFADAWEVGCADDGEGNTWLSLRMPNNGASAAYRCKTNTDNGPTISSQVAHAFALASSQPTDGGVRNG